MLRGNAMFVSAFLEGRGGVGREKGTACKFFALKTLDRMLAEAWKRCTGFAHRIGGARLDGSLDDQILPALRCFDAYEATLDRRYFDAAQRAADFAIAEYFDAEGGGFFDRASGTAPWEASKCGASRLQIHPRRREFVAAILLDRFCPDTTTRAIVNHAELHLKRSRASRRSWDSCGRVTTRGAAALSPGV